MDEEIERGRDEGTERGLFTSRGISATQMTGVMRR